MINFTSKHLWLAVKQIPRLASHKKIALVEKFGLNELFQGKCELGNIGLTSKQLDALRHPDWQKITQIIENANYCGCQVLTYDDPLYPHALKNIYDPPLVLFALGNSELLNLAQIAIVGSRNASAAGREHAQNIAAQLSEYFVITSGMALGIDANAHRGALNANSYTIAVVATGLDITYPARHKSLQKEILNANGLIISEFAPGVMAKAGHFPKRNRIISGMCHGVLVVEASMRSGSLITARYALEQGRDVFAMPGSIANPQVKGVSLVNSTRG